MREFGPQIHQKMEWRFRGILGGKKNRVEERRWGCRPALEMIIVEHRLIKEGRGLTPSENTRKGKNEIASHNNPTVKVGRGPEDGEAIIFLIGYSDSWLSVEAAAERQVRRLALAAMCAFLLHLTL
ncbi:hypothetical protein SRHO_G00204920 [Serrasalmus rhombeus]